MFSLRQFAGTAPVLLVIARAFFVVLFLAFGSRAEASPRTCEDAAELAFLAAPIAPWNGAPLRVVFAVERSYDGELSLIAPNGKIAAKSRKRHGGPPYFWFAEVNSPAAGKWQARLVLDRAPAECSRITRDITVRGVRPPPRRATSGSVWPLLHEWNRATENLYSAWIEKLFDAPLDMELSWRALHYVIRDRSRNFLFNYLGLREDEMKLVIRPDCADLPYFLRAYFAFKMGLPFGFSKCSRGSGGKPPRCYQWFSIQNLETTRPSSSERVAAITAPEPKTAPPTLLDLLRKPAAPQSIAPQPNAPPASRLVQKRLGLAAAFGAYLQTIADGVHSGTGRTPLSDNKTDYYPVALRQDMLRPGTVYADPYGHILILVQRVRQSGNGAGIFLAVDAQPDGTVARKRFWRGNFLFAQDSRLGGPGFKRFRPIVLGKSGSLRQLTNKEIASNPQYGDFSLEQSRLQIEEFYDRMDDVMSPEPLDPLRAMKEAITSFEEQVKIRVTSVENGRKYQHKRRDEVSMPNGAAIFETTGPWEDFSTPARDLRLLIALDVVRSFPDRVARRPDRYAMPKGTNIAEVRAQLQNVLASELPARKFTYPRSDGSAWTLSLKDVFDRAAALEMAYNPNDCVELRWGAPANSQEASTCKRHAPSLQQAKMAEYRVWFHERRRPPRR